MKPFRKIFDKYRSEISALFLAYLSTIYITFDKTIKIVDCKSFFDLFKNDNFLLSAAGFILIYFFVKTNRIGELVKKEKTIIHLFSFILSFMYIIGTDITYHRETLRGSVNLYSILYFILFLIIGYIILNYYLAILYKKIQIKGEVGEQIRIEQAKKKYIMMFLPILMVRLFFFIIFYPGITTYDSMYMLKEGLGYAHLSNSHPYLYTYTVGFFGKMGLNYLGGVGNGIGLFNFITIVITSIVYTWVLYRIFKIKFDKKIKALIYLFYCIHPYFILYSFTVYKDIYLMLFLLLFFVCMFDIMYHPETFFSRKVSLLLFILSFLGVYMMHRKAVIYLVVGIVSVIVFNKEYRRRALKYSAVALIFTLLFNSIGEGILKPTPSGKPYDYLSPRFQQLAAAVYFHPDTFTNEELKVYDEILGLKNIGQFDYTTVDPIKNHLNNEEFSEHNADFLKMWWKGYKNHPKRYIDVVLNLSVSYWYPYNYPDVVYVENYYSNMYLGERKVTMTNQDHDVSLDEGWQRNMNSFTFKMIRYLDTFWFSELANYPIFSLLFRPGFYTIVLIIWFMLALLRRNRTILPLIVLIFSIILTCIYSPVVNYFRYSYIFITLIPLIYPILRLQTKSVNTSDEEE